MKNPGGRPHLYKPEYCEQLIEYFDVDLYTTRIKTTTFGRGNTVEEEVDVPTDFPTLAGFAIKLGVSRMTLWQWATEKDEEGNLKHPEFSDVYSRAKDYQQNWLAVNGLKGTVNPRFAIFVAKNVTDWREKPEGEAPDTVVNNNTLTVSPEVAADLLKIARGEANDD